MKKVFLVAMILLAAAACNQVAVQPQTQPAPSNNTPTKLTTSSSTACTESEFSKYLPKNISDYYNTSDPLTATFSDSNIGIVKMQVPYSTQWLNGDYNVPQFEEVKDKSGKVTDVVFGKPFCPTGPGEGGYYNGNWGRFFDMQITPHRSAEEALAAFRKDSNIENDKKSLNDPKLAADWEAMFKIEKIGNVTVVFGAAPYFSIADGTAWTEVVGNKFNYLFEYDGLMHRNSEDAVIREIIKTMVLSQ